MTKEKALSKAETLVQAEHLTLAAAIDEFLAAERYYLRPSTIATYRSHLDAFAAAHEGAAVRDVDPRSCGRTSMICFGQGSDTRRGVGASPCERYRAISPPSLGCRSAIARRWMICGSRSRKP
jgi:hypothetical protein